MPTTRSPNWRRRIFSRAETSASTPVPELAPRSWRSSTVQRPVSSKAATVKESSRRSMARATGPRGCAEGTPVGRPRARCRFASAGLLSSSISSRPARSLTSTVAVPRARLSCLVSSARVRRPAPSWTARSSRARLCARSSALVVAAPSSFRTIRSCHAWPAPARGGRPGGAVTPPGQDEAGQLAGLAGPRIPYGGYAARNPPVITGQGRVFHSKIKDKRATSPSESRRLSSRRDADSDGRRIGYRGQRAREPR